MAVRAYCGVDFTLFERLAVYRVTVGLEWFAFRKLELHHSFWIIVATGAGFRDILPVYGRVGMSRFEKGMAAAMAVLACRRLGYPAAHRHAVVRGRVDSSLYRVAAFAGDRGWLLRMRQLGHVGVARDTSVITVCR